MDRRAVRRVRPAGNGAGLASRAPAADGRTPVVWRQNEGPLRSLWSRTGSGLDARRAWLRQRTRIDGAVDDASHAPQAAVLSAGTPPSVRAPFTGRIGKGGKAVAP